MNKKILAVIISIIVLITMFFIFRLIFNISLQKSILYLIPIAFILAIFRSIYGNKNSKQLKINHTKFYKKWLAFSSHFLYCGAWVLRGIQGGACAPLTSGYLHQIRRYLASKYRACQTLLVSFVESDLIVTFTLRTIRPSDVLKGWDL